MTDMFSRAKRSWVMAQIKGENTQPEVLVRRMLHANGYRFRLQGKDLPGRPDIVLPKYKAAIFVHGCFWHGHGRCKEGRRPKSNLAYWNQKIDGNIRRDRRTARKYRSLGWRRFVVWTCELEQQDRAERRINKLLTDLAA
jgi:DNA mismatch endonuclease, patch repair protein